LGPVSLAVFSRTLAGRRRLVNTHRQGVERAGAGERGDVKAPPQKGAVDAAQVGAVEIDLGLPVDAVKIEPEFPAGSRSGKGELVAVTRSPRRRRTIL